MSLSQAPLATIGPCLFSLSGSPSSPPTQPNGPCFSIHLFSPFSRDHRRALAGHWLLFAFPRPWKSPCLQIATQDNTVSFSQCLLPTLCSCSSSDRVKPPAGIYLCDFIDFVPHCWFVPARCSAFCKRRFTADLGSTKNTLLTLYFLSAVPGTGDG